GGRPGPGGERPRRGREHRRGWCRGAEKMSARSGISLDVRKVAMRRIQGLTVFVIGVALAGVVTSAATVQTFVRLTPAQYRHTIQDIFGANIQVPANSVDPGVRDRGLLALGTRKLALSAAELERYEVLAQQVATQVVDPRNRATLLPCKPKAEN